MGEWVCFALGCAEFGIFLFAFAAAVWVFAQALESLWFIHADKVQFYIWLAEQNKKADN